MPLCREKKLKLAGGEDFFTCDLLRLDCGFGLLRYVIDRNYLVSDVQLRPGDLTHGLYWCDRPYTLYVWHFSGNRAAFYFNIADSVVLSPETFIWRDLVIDILIDPEQRVHVLDEDELPEHLPPALLSYIESSKQLILSQYPDIIREADAIVNAALGDAGPAF